MLLNLEIACSVSRLERNLGILRMRNAISRLRKFSNCAEHIQNSEKKKKQRIKELMGSEGILKDEQLW